jgi:hypothetical protein
MELKNPNRNCLEGVRCPRCGHYDDFKVCARVLLQVTDSGTEQLGGHVTFEDSDQTTCGSCGFFGAWSDFQDP